MLALGDRELREAAMQALTMIGAPAAETLAACAPDLESELRADAYALLPRLGPAASDPRVQALLAEALDDEASEAAAAAAGALGEVGDREALAPLLRALGREEAVAHAAADALGRLGARHYDEVRVLVQSRGLGGPDAPYLCRALGACGRADDAPLLRQALGADAPAVRRAAAEALAQLPPSTRRRRGADLRAGRRIGRGARLGGARARRASRRGGAPMRWPACALEGEPLVRAAAARALGLVATAHAVGARSLLRRVADARDPAAAVPALEALAQLDDAPTTRASSRALDVARRRDGQGGGARARRCAPRRRPTRSSAPRCRRSSARSSIRAGTCAARRCWRSPTSARCRALVGAPRARAGSAGARGDRVGAGRRAGRALMVARRR